MLFDTKILVSIFAKIHPCLRFWAKSRAEIPAFFFNSAHGNCASQLRCWPKTQPDPPFPPVMQGVPNAFEHKEPSPLGSLGWKVLWTSFPSLWNYWVATENLTPPLQAVFSYFSESFFKKYWVEFSTKILLQMRISYAYGLFSRGNRSQSAIFSKLSHWTINNYFLTKVLKVILGKGGGGCVKEEHQKFTSFPVLSLGCNSFRDFSISDDL